MNHVTVLAGILHTAIQHEDLGRDELVDAVAAIYEPLLVMRELMQVWWTGAQQAISQGGRQAPPTTEQEDHR